MLAKHFLHMIRDRVCEITLTRDFTHETKCKMPAARQIEEKVTLIPCLSLPVSLVLLDRVTGSSN